MFCLSLMARAVLAAALNYLFMVAPVCREECDTCPRKMPVTAVETATLPERGSVKDAMPSNFGRRHVSDVPEKETPALEAIQAARQQQGNLLQGTLVEKLSQGAESASREFIEALSRVAAEDPAPPAKQDMPLPLGPSRMAPEPATYETPAPALQSLEPTGNAALRQAARELETRAADLEEARQYHQADRLRTLAQQIRLEARSWEE